MVSRLEHISKTFFIIGLFERRRFYYAAALITVAAIMEVGGVAIIYPYIDFLLTPAKIHQNEVTSYFFNVLAIESENKFLFILGIATIVFVVSSSFVAAAAKYVHQSYVWNLNASLTKTLYEKYLRESYLVHKNSNATQMTKNVLNEVSVFVNGLLVPFFEIITRSIVVMAFAILLIYVDPKAALASIAVGGALYFLIYKVIRPYITEMSSERFKVHEDLFEYVNSSFRGVKDIQVNKIETEFVARVARPARLYSRLNLKISLISIFPKYILEAVIFSAAVTVLLFYIGERSIVELVPIISLYAISAFRLVPHLQNIYAALTKFRFNLSALDLLEKELRNQDLTEHERTKIAPKPFQLLEAKDIHFRFSEKDEWLILGCNLRVHRGDFVVLIGESGSGKSTFVEILLGLLTPQRGGVFYNSNQLLGSQLATDHVSVGYVSQDVYLFEGSLAENIRFGCDTDHGLDHLTACLRAACLEDLVPDQEYYEFDIADTGKDLSGGQKQRLAIARALYKKPSLLILDEATNALDKINERRIIDNIIRSQTSVIMITHHEHLHASASHVFELNNYKLVERKRVVDEEAS